MTRRSWWASAVAIGLALVLVGPTAPALGEQVGSPQAPTGVTATVVDGGVRVAWTPPAGAGKAITHYVVHAGQGSCPVTVGAQATSAVMPVVQGQRRITPRVQAVNAAGYSPDAKAAGSVNVKGRANPNFTNLQVLEFSDFHGAIDDTAGTIGAAVLVSAFERDRKAVPRTVTISAGDNFGASPALSSQFDELPTIQALNLMGLQVSTTGNHEHDRPLAHLRQMIDASDFAWVVSNYSTLAPLRTGKKKLEPFTVLDAGGLKVGVVGMNTEDTNEVTPPGNLDYGPAGRKTITISPDVAGVNKRVKAARAAGADVVIAALHQGWQANVDGVPTGRLIEVTRELRGVDLAFGGHTHQSFASIVAGTPVAQTRNSGQEYTRTQVCIDRRTDSVVGASTQMVTEAMLAGVTPDPQTAALVKDYKDRLSAKLDRRIGTVDGTFIRGGIPPVERAGESALGDYIADALRARYGTDLAFLTGGGLRDSLPATGYEPQDTTLRRPSPGSSGPYDVTLGDALSVFPFNNSIATTTVTGRNLWAALENGVSGYPSDGRFPQVSGLRFTFDPNRPEGQRIVSVTTADGRPIAADDTRYTVTTLDFLVDGGDGYEGFFSPTTAEIRDSLGDTFVDIISSDTARNTVVRVPILDGRITRVG